MPISFAPMREWMTQIGRLCALMHAQPGQLLSYVEDSSDLEHEKNI